jgi:hypothetical protein
LVSEDTVVADKRLQTSTLAPAEGDCVEAGAGAAAAPPLAADEDADDDEQPAAVSSPDRARPAIAAPAVRERR